jgi:hypothetical protein
MGNCSFNVLPLHSNFADTELNNSKIRYAKFADCLRRAGQLPQCTCKGGGTDSITKSRGVEQFTEHAVVLILRGRIYQSWEVGPHRCDVARKESDGMN